MNRTVQRAGVPVAVLGLALLVVALGPIVAPHSVSAMTAPPWSSSDGALLGTDALGRDTWSRTLAGGTHLVWASLPVGLVTTVCGAVLGLLSTEVRWLGRIIGATTSVVMAVPASLVVLCAAVLLPAIPAVCVTMLLFGVPLSARIIRAAAEPLTGAEFLRTARRRGESAWYIVVGELVPALSGTVIADLSVRVIASLQLLAALHVLGFGPPPPTPDWAVMIRENLPGVTLQPWSVAAPAVALAVFSVTVTVCLDAVSHVLNPDAREERRRRSSADPANSVAPDDNRSTGGERLRIRGMTVGAGTAGMLNVPALDLGPGDILGIVGPSGSGKSTLLEAIVGVRRAGLEVSADEHLLGGEQMPASSRRRAELRRRVVGWAEQDPAETLDGRRSVLDVVRDARRLSSAARADLTNLLARLGLSEHLVDARTAALSGGQAARVALARALAGGPDLLVLDEPTAGLDRDSIDAVTAELVRFAGAGGAVVVTSHDTDWLAGLTTRTVRIQGSLLRPVQSGAPSPEQTSIVPAGGDAAGPPSPDNDRNGAPLIDCSGLTVAVRGHVNALSRDLTVLPGEVIAVVGSSGSGKSSLLRMLGGDVLPPEVVVSGNGTPEPGAVGPHDVQLMVQDSSASLNPGRTLLSQVTRHAEAVARCPRRAARRLAAEILATVGLSPEVTARRPGECSGGERQRACLARTLLGDAPLLLLDEPTSALDGDNRLRVLSLVRAEAEKGRGVLITTHDAVVARAADRVVAFDVDIPQDRAVRR